MPWAISMTRRFPILVAAVIATTAFVGQAQANPQFRLGPKGAGPIVVPHTHENQLAKPLPQTKVCMTPGHKRTSGHKMTPSHKQC